MEREPFVYMLASRRHGTIYTGVTSNLLQRVWQHRNGAVQGFASRYSVRRLVWYEPHAIMDAAILRERRIKEWQRAWKVRLIEAENPFWDDLAVGLGFAPLAKDDGVPRPGTPRHPGGGRDP